MAYRELTWRQLAALAAVCDGEPLARHKASLPSLRRRLLIERAPAASGRRPGWDGTAAGRAELARAAGLAEGDTP